MTEEQQSKLTSLALVCTRAVLEGQDTVTVSKDGPRRVPGFPRGELLSVGTDGSHNYAVCPLKVLAWIHSGTKGGLAMERALAKGAGNA